jgi:demethylmenaquinone methyltransferase/2-methoxy-6-polyprenyl-1,4-benzoquinol methylase
MVEDVDAVLDEQVRYYRARAPEYDEWFLRQGYCDLGAELNERWFDEVEEVAAALDRFAPTGRVLEFASGTGWWTERLARHAATLVAVDASPETADIARRRVGRADVRFVTADIFGYEPDAAYDVVFFSFWLSHVPAERFNAFWELVEGALAPGGRVFFVDNLAVRLPDGARRSQLQVHTDGTAVRRLNDGRTFRIVKLYHEPDELTRRLGELGWDVRIPRTETFLYYGHGSRRG